MYPACHLGLRLLATVALLLPITLPAFADDAPWYPRTLESENGSAIIYAPQIDSWARFRAA